MQYEPAPVMPVHWSSVAQAVHVAAWARQTVAPAVVWPQKQAPLPLQDKSLKVTHWFAPGAQVPAGVGGTVVVVVGVRVVVVG